ncbi:hypothetical protein D3C86_959260 [compost metagenome]
MQKRVPPFAIKGSASLAMRMKDQHDTSIACRKPAREQSVTRPRRSSRGAKAIECSTKSSPPHSSAMRSKTDSSSPSFSRFSGISSDASTWRASGSTCGSALSLR